MIKIKKIPIIIVAGPTASGKTSLGVHLAKTFDGEVVSADSMQIYKKMDIGTAKPTEAEKDGVRHHLMDFLSPFDNYSVADFVADAHKCIEDITKRGKLPIIVGGTGLYIDSLANDISFEDGDFSSDIRSELLKIAEEKGGEYLLEMLAEFDQDSAKKLHPSNIRRIIRAIEFYRLTGKTISAHNEETKNAKSRYNPLFVMLDWDREILYKRIDERVDIMLKAGLISETEALIKMGVNLKMQSMQGIGYKEMLCFFKGLCTLDEAVRLIKRNSRRYAKRQLTWFRRNKDIKLINPYRDAFSDTEKEVREFLSKNI